MQKIIIEKMQEKSYTRMVAFAGLLTVKSK